MKCPYLMTLIVSLCRIEGRAYTPSVLELHDFCRSEGYARCPLYKKMGDASRKAEKKDETQPESSSREV